MPFNGTATGFESSRVMDKSLRAKIKSDDLDSGRREGPFSCRNFTPDSPQNYAIRSHPSSLGHECREDEVGPKIGSLTKYNFIVS
jgi:hypothetical protein